MGQVVALTTNEQQDEWATWDNFWTVWPRRVARKEAQRAWDRLTPAERQEALTALPDWRRVWAGKETQYIPHPATWLNGARWEDELPPEFQRAKQVQVQAKTNAEPAEWRKPPDEFKRLLEQMKGRK